jgi:cob(I)alamin adenosyltransferase
MPRITKVYTRTGDDGTTGLGGGQRVSKDDLRIEAYGAVDELNSLLGLALATGLDERLSREVEALQQLLFNLGADLCLREEDKAGRRLPSVEESHIRQMEALIDELARELGPLEDFILPGGSPGASALHVARSVCRRAERRVVALKRREAVGPHVVAFLNRLSDLLFVAARYENRKRGHRETLWESGA